MSAFDRILSGTPGLDNALDNIRLGDNVVWQVSCIEEYKFFTEPFVKQAIADKRKTIYIHFAKNEPLFKPMQGLEIHTFDPEEGFEPFTVSINELISQMGFDAFYVFDSLSELQAAWWADLMMGNFFRLTCPHLFDLDTVAFFPLFRGKHSFDTIARIRDTTQLLLNVYSSDSELYLYPLKVWHRYSPTMFLPHKLDRTSNTFEPLTDGVGMGKFYGMLNSENAVSPDQNSDSWERWFSKVKSDYKNGIFSEQTRHDLCRSMISRDSRMTPLVEKYYTPEDYFKVRSRMVGTGTIGGKSCGMLLARKIVEFEMPEDASLFEPHDSFYIGSDVFYTYIVHNGCWKLRISQKTNDGWFSVAEKLQKQLLEGEFPDQIRDPFRRLLEYYGQNPIIVRSSSLLEDSFGNAFAGKYESVFCSNQGTFNERLAEFENAVRTVYASTMDRSALEYRKCRGLATKDEQMAILVQRVSGTNYGDFYMPSAAGVGYSYSAWRYLENMDPKAGMIRIVAGLGTRAVDRIASDYPRIANLDNPSASVHTTIAQKHRYSQKYLDVIDFREKKLSTQPLQNLISYFKSGYQAQVLEHDYEAESFLRDQGRPRDVLFANCQGLLENRTFVDLMKKMLHVLQSAYNNPVDIEFTVNTNEENEFVVNLLQCRPLQILSKSTKAEMPKLLDEKALFKVKGSAMGVKAQIQIDTIVEVDTRAYHEYPYSQKPKIASLIGRIEAKYKKQGKNPMLLVPGRIGTSSPDLGVPVTFADIDGFKALCEKTDSSIGFSPELSYGSHIFQDLVEAEIFYAALPEIGRGFNPAFLTKYPDVFINEFPEESEYVDMVRVYLLQEPITISLDATCGDAECG